MWDEAVPDNDVNDIRYHHGCSDAVADMAALSLATDTSDVNVAHRMGFGPVNLMTVTSAMGRGAI